VHFIADYERLLVAARDLGSCNELIILLGGQAGLRCGEIAALEWTDVDLTLERLCVQRSEWRGHVTTPKGGRFRFVRMSTALLPPCGGIRVGGGFGCCALRMVLR
jgi:integrase